MLALAISLPGQLWAAIYIMSSIWCFSIIFCIFLEQSFSWDKRSHQEEVYVFKVLWQNSKFWNCSNIRVLFLITYPNLHIKQKTSFCTRQVRSQQKPLYQVIAPAWGCHLPNTEVLIHTFNTSLHDCYEEGFTLRNVCGTRYVPLRQKKAANLPGHAVLQQQAEVMLLHWNS